MERRQYRNPPIEEALCEFRFAPGPEWDLTVPGRFFEAIRDSYPGKPRQQNIMEAQFQVQQQPTEPSFELKQGFTKVQFPTDDGRRLVAIGPDVLSIHILRPYRNWEEFQTRINEAYSRYLMVAEPAGVRRIGLRYINRIVLQGELIDLGSYFTAAPDVPPELPQAIGAFLSRIQTTYDDQPIQLAITFASTDAPEGQSAFLLDIDLSIEWLEEPTILEKAMGYVEEMRRRERTAFEALITDRAREVFDAE